MSIPFSLSSCGCGHHIIFHKQFNFPGGIVVEKCRFCMCNKFVEDKKPVFDDTKGVLQLADR